MTTTEHPATMCEAFQRTAAIDPDAVALRTPGDTKTLTWREYAAQVRQVTAGLAGLGVRRVDTVSLMLANRIEFHPLEVGAQHVGATSFSVYTTLPAEQLTPSGDEIALTMKLKRKPIVTKYAAEIEDLYARDLHPEVHEPLEPRAAETVQPA
jgi:long-subunit acyl-CoA synthetase (AMP-forming)